MIWMLLTLKELFVFRPANKIGEYAELGNVTRDSAKATEVKFLEECEKRIADNGGKLKVVDINKKE